MKTFDEESATALAEADFDIRQRIAALVAASFGHTITWVGVEPAATCSVCPERKWPCASALDAADQLLEQDWILRDAYNFLPREAIDKWPPPESFFDDPNSRD